MPLEFKTNQYPGPNAHLLSLQQSSFSSNHLWRSFHERFIDAIAVQLKERAPESYQVQIVDSIQKADHTPLTPFDVTAIVIHPIDTSVDVQAESVRIECLSPLNSDQRLAYANRRREALEQGLILYEIELCHETPTLLPRPSYLVDPYAQAYAIGLTKPNVHTQWQGFGVDEPFPNLDMILGADDIVPNLDLGRAYNHAFFLSNSGVLIDYLLPPDPKRDPNSMDVASNKYTLPDQDLIRARMAHIAELYEQGVDLDAVMPRPLP